MAESMKKDFEEKDAMLARFQKLAKSINKYDPNYDKVLDLERIRGLNYKNISYAIGKNKTL